VHREHAKVEVPVAVPLGLAERSFLDAPEPQRNRGAPFVAHYDPDLDAVQPPRAERVRVNARTG
jgi:hypothetical protein